MGRDIIDSVCDFQNPEFKPDFVRPSEMLNSSFKDFKIFEAKQNSEKL